MKKFVVVYVVEDDHEPILVNVTAKTQSAKLFEVGLHWAEPYYQDEIPLPDLEL